MESFPSRRAQSPAYPRTPSGADGHARLRATLQLLLALLAALLGRRPRAVRLAAHPLPLQADALAQDWWIDLPETEAAPFPLLDVLTPPIEVARILYLFGTRRNLGMRALARALPLARPRLARAPPGA